MKADTEPYQDKKGEVFAGNGHGRKKVRHAWEKRGFGGRGVRGEQRKIGTCKKIPGGGWKVGSSSRGKVCWGRKQKKLS